MNKKLKREIYLLAADKIMVRYNSYCCTAIEDSIGILTFDPLKYEQKFKETFTEIHLFKNSPRTVWWSLTDSDEKYIVNKLEDLRSQRTIALLLCAEMCR